MRAAAPSTRPLSSSSLPPARPSQPLTSSIPPQSGDQRVNELKAQLVQARHELSNTQNELRAARGERDNLRAELGRAKARIDELELAAREAEERASAAPAPEAPKAPEPPAPVPALNSELEVELRSRIADLEAELEAMRDKPASPKKPPAAGLTSIKGIGPKFEKALRAAGISSVSQVAAWTDADITRVAKLLGIKAQRIQKENWVGTARSLSVEA
jgi:predicted flap endonuclease-1-like 5' DNA nuclease